MLNDTWWEKNERVSFSSGVISFGVNEIYSQTRCE